VVLEALEEPERVAEPVQQAVPVVQVGLVAQVGLVEQEPLAVPGGLDPLVEQVVLEAQELQERLVLREVPEQRESAFMVPRVQEVHPQQRLRPLLTHAMLGL